MLEKNTITIECGKSTVICDVGTVNVIMKPSNVWKK